MILAAVLLAEPAVTDETRCAALAGFSAPDNQIDRVGAAAASAFLPEHFLVRGLIGRRSSSMPGNTLGNGFELRLPAA